MMMMVMMMSFVCLIVCLFACLLLRSSESSVGVSGQLQNEGDISEPQWKYGRRRDVHSQVQRQ